MTPPRIAIVGEAWGREEEEKKRPFVGMSGHELDLLLSEVGIRRSDCLVTNVLNARPFDEHNVPTNDIEKMISFNKKAPREEFVQVRNAWVHPRIEQGMRELEAELDTYQPDLIIALGNTPLWALYGERGITTWRGSELTSRFIHPGVKLIPTLHPAFILRDYSTRWQSVIDLTRAKREAATKEYSFPNYQWSIPTGLLEASNRILSLIRLADQSILPLAVDYETIRREIACIGIAWSKTDAACIPFRTSKEYFTLDEETILVKYLQTLLTHPNVRLIFQNGNYDVQVMLHKWHFMPRIADDTMVLQSVLYPGVPKSLAFIASQYCDHYVYWKDELEDYKSAPLDDKQFFEYNCKDVCYTYEVWSEQKPILAYYNLEEVYNFQMQKLWPAVLKMQIRGLHRDEGRKSDMLNELEEARLKRNKFVTSCVGYDLNPRSSLQMKKFLYDEMGLKRVYDKKTKKLTANFDALREHGENFPLLWPIAEALLEIRSIGTYISSFISPELDYDSRIRTSFDIAGPETYRLSSRKDIFGRGMNFQNLPTDTSDRKKLRFPLPNIRELILPPPGYVVADCDLDRADLQYVVWEANDADLKLALKMGVDMHCFNACFVFDIKNIPADELIESHPNYYEHRGRIGYRRQLCKNGVHATNYGAQKRTLSRTLMCAESEAEKFRKRWLSVHPGILNWHKRILAQLNAPAHEVHNIFGYHRIFFGRPDDNFTNALAWQPQSSVAITINRALVQIDELFPEILLAVQVHDSTVQFIPYNFDRVEALRTAVHITAPYPDPLTIPVGIKLSNKSWGHCGKKKDPQAHNGWEGLKSWLDTLKTG